MYHHPNLVKTMHLRLAAVAMLAPAGSIERKMNRPYAVIHRLSDDLEEVCIMWFKRTPDEKGIAQRLERHFLPEEGHTLTFHELELHQLCGAEPNFEEEYLSRSLRVHDLAHATIGRLVGSEDGIRAACALNADALGPGGFQALQATALCIAGHDSESAVAIARQDLPSTIECEDHEIVGDLELQPKNLTETYAGSLQHNGVDVSFEFIVPRGESQQARDAAAFAALAQVAQVEYLAIGSSHRGTGRNVRASRENAARYF